MPHQSRPDLSQDREPSRRVAYDGSHEDGRHHPFSRCRTGGRPGKPRGSRGMNIGSSFGHGLLQMSGSTRWHRPLQRTFPHLVAFRKRRFQQSCSPASLASGLPSFQVSMPSTRAHVFQTLPWSGPLGTRMPLLRFSPRLDTQTPQHSGLARAAIAPVDRSGGRDQLRVRWHETVTAKPRHPGQLERFAVTRAWQDVRRQALSWRCSRTGSCVPGVRVRHPC